MSLDPICQMLFSAMVPTLVMPVPCLSGVPGIVPVGLIYKYDMSTFPFFNLPSLTLRRSGLNFLCQTATSQLGLGRHQNRRSSHVFSGVRDAETK